MIIRQSMLLPMNTHIHWFPLHQGRKTLLNNRNSIMLPLPPTVKNLNKVKSSTLFSIFDDAIMGNCLLSCNIRNYLGLMPLDTIFIPVLSLQHIHHVISIQGNFHPNFSQCIELFVSFLKDSTSLWLLLQLKIRTGSYHIVCYDYLVK